MSRRYFKRRAFSIVCGVALIFAAGCSLISDEPPDCTPLDVRNEFGDTTLVLGTWNFDRSIQIGFGEVGCIVTTAASREAEPSITFHDGGLYTESGDGSYSEGTYKFERAAGDEELYRVILEERSSAVVSVANDTLVIDYSHVDGPQSIYLRR